MPATAPTHEIATTDRRSVWLLVGATLSLLSLQVLSPLVWFLTHHRMRAMADAEVGPDLTLRMARWVSIAGTILLAVPFL